MKKRFIQAFFLMLLFTTYSYSQDPVEDDYKKKLEEILGKESKTPDTKTPPISENMDYLDRALYLLDNEGTKSLAFAINGNIWTKKSFLKDISESETPKLRIKNKLEESASSATVSIFTSERSDFSFIKLSKEVRSLGTMKGAKPENATLLVYYTEKDKDPMTDKILSSAYTVTIKWDGGTGTVQEKLKLPDTKYLAGVLIQKNQVNDAQDISMKTESGSSLMPLGVFQYQAAGFLVKEGDQIVVKSIPSDIGSFNSKQKKTEQEDVQKDRNGKIDTKSEPKKVKKKEEPKSSSAKDRRNERRNKS